ncbi:unnamed protein product [Acanthoscelides obtectus]|uniref:DUF4371 domain-containing protein n=1 Tax=Acanthoscelides obtectus TaxID=200917 RepID=A0A9P0QAB2_ACAOB|nr:unnamed protein product [Acanthoscelides obtectus]CAK1659908.1 Zinc finger MYM-type protein 1 [Acanthoscelides obtectus]
MELALLGTVNIIAQLDSAYWRNIQEHNDTVTKNRYVLSKIIDGIKFCGAFELALRDHDETASSQNPGIFRGLINFFDTTLSEHIKNASIFKGTSKEIQNDLLNCILEVSHEEIIKQINRASYLAIIADETTDISGKSQLVTIFRYVFNGEKSQKRETEPAQVKTAIYNFEKCIVDVRNKIDNIKEAKSICTEPQVNKRRRRNNSSHDHRVAALEVCDNIISIQRFGSRIPFFPGHFGEYCGKFPDDKLETTCLAYPELEKSRLKTELSVIYARNDYRDLHGTLSLLKFLIQNSL